MQKKGELSMQIKDILLILIGIVEAAGIGILI